MPKYPHMLPKDIDIWDRFLKQYGAMWERYEYDIHVGGSVDVQPHWSNETIRMAKTLAAKRIDAIGYRSDQICIFEVKPEAGVTAVGQLVLYKMLYEKDYKPILPVVCRLVCENCLPDEREAIIALGFVVIMV